MSTKKTIKKILLATPGFQSICRFLTRRHIRVLMYHRFSQKKEKDARFVNASTLHDQLEYIHKHHVNWVPDEQLAALKKERPIKGCPVIITVDDGYRDFYDVAFPACKALGFRPVLFVTTAFVDGQILLWWDRLKQMITASGATSLQLQLADIAFDFPLKTRADQENAWNTLADHCRFLPHHQKEDLLNKIAGILTVPVDLRDRRYRAVTWEQLREMDREGVVMGAHTQHHPLLSRLSPDEAREEVTGSKKTLEKQLRRDVSWFCYPQGGPADFTDQTKEIVQQSGFQGSYIAYQNLSFDFYALPRYCITCDMLHFKWCLCGAEYLMLRSRQALGYQIAPGQSYWSGASGSGG